MEKEFINLTPENLDGEHLCCIIRSKKPTRGWSQASVALRPLEGGPRVPEAGREGHSIYRVRPPGDGPGSRFWGTTSLYIYCLWVLGGEKGKGYGRALMEHCLADARDRGKSGICMLGAEKQKAWLSDQSFARKYGFETVDETGYGYTLLARSFDGTLPRFTDQARAGTIEEKALTIYYSDQCPMRSTAWRSSGRCVERPGLRILWCLWTHWRRPRLFPACSTTTPCFTAVPSRR